MSSNTLTDLIPADLFKLTKLEILNLRDNKLRSRLSSNVGSLTNLTKLILDTNEIYGSLPSSLTKLTLLDTISLADTYVAGSVPDLSFVTKRSPSGVVSLNNTCLTVLSGSGYTARPTSTCDAFYNSNGLSIADPSDSSSIPIGAIAGGVAGAIVLIVTAVIAFLIIKRKRDSAAAAAKLAQQPPTLLPQANDVRLEFPVAPPPTTILPTPEPEKSAHLFNVGAPYNGGVGNASSAGSTSQTGAKYDFANMDGSLTGTSSASQQPHGDAKQHHLFAGASSSTPSPYGGSARSAADFASHKKSDRAAVTGSVSPVVPAPPHRGISEPFLAARNPSHPLNEAALPSYDVAAADSAAQAVNGPVPPLRTLSMAGSGVQRTRAADLGVDALMESLLTMGVAPRVVEKLRANGVTGARFIGMDREALLRM
ncbi:hypothetical protein HDU96_010582, partial [Phlyctochytrium bullatum]